MTEELVGALTGTVTETTTPPELYAEARDETFSVLVGTEYDHDTKEPRTVQMLTPIYRHPEE